MAKNTEKSISKNEESKITEKTKNTLVPPVDIFEDADMVTLLADLPGVGKDDLEIQIDKDTLQIYGKIKRSAESEAERHYIEFPEKDFYRAFTIGDEINKDKISASINNGVLKLVLPKSERIKPKKIEIQFS